MIRFIKMALAAFFVFAVFTEPVGAQSEFFKDKTIRFIVGYSAGGSFDLYTRVIARHFPKHVPGSPTTVVENMTGAGGVIAGNHLFNRVQPDRLTIWALGPPRVRPAIIREQARQFYAR